MCVTADGAVVCNMADLWLLSVLAASVYSTADNLKSHFVAAYGSINTT